MDIDKGGTAVLRSIGALAGALLLALIFGRAAEAAEDGDSSRAFSYTMRRYDERLQRGIDLIYNLQFEAADRFFHDGAGLFMMPLGMLVLWGEVVLLDKLFLEPVTERPLALSKSIVGVGRAAGSGGANTRCSACASRLVIVRRPAPPRPAAHLVARLGSRA